MSEVTTHSQNKDGAEVVRPDKTRGAVHFVPRVDICETANELWLFADLPGVKPEDVDLHYEKGELTLFAHVKPRGSESARLLLREHHAGDFYRAFHIHESIDSARIEASCKNGMLSVRLPKVEAAKPRQIAVRGG